MKHHKSNNELAKKLLLDRVQSSPEMAVEVLLVLIASGEGGKSNAPALYSYDEDGYPDEYLELAGEAGLTEDMFEKPAKLKRAGWKKIDPPGSNNALWVKGFYGYAYSQVDYVPPCVYVVVPAT